MCACVLNSSFMAAKVAPAAAAGAPADEHDHVELDPPADGGEGDSKVEAEEEDVSTEDHSILPEFFSYFPPQWPGRPAASQLIGASPEELKTAEAAVIAGQRDPVKRSDMKANWANCTRLTDAERRKYMKSLAWPASHESYNAFVTSGAKFEAAHVNVLCAPANQARAAKALATLLSSRGETLLKGVLDMQLALASFASKFQGDDQMNVSIRADFGKLLRLNADHGQHLCDLLIKTVMDGTGRVHAAAPTSAAAASVSVFGADSTLASRIVAANAVTALSSAATPRSGAATTSAPPRGGGRSGFKRSYQSSSRGGGGFRGNSGRGGSGGGHTKRGRGGHRGGSSGHSSPYTNNAPSGKRDDRDRDSRGRPRSF